MSIEDLKDKLNENSGEKPKENSQDNADINSIKSDLEKSKQREQEREKEISDLKFVNEFNELSPKYPHAKEFKDAIKEKVSKGYTLEDAAVSVLSKEGKLITADQVRASERRGEGFGGSADTVHVDDSGKEKTVEELRKDFQDMEARGEIKLA